MKYCKNVQNLYDIIYVKENFCEQECELDCSKIDSVAADMIIQYNLEGKRSYKSDRVNYSTARITCQPECIIIPVFSVIYLSN